MTLKASPRAGLSESQLTRLQSLLEHKRTELTKRLAAVQGRVGGEHENLADPVDRASESEEDAEELGVAKPDHEILAEIERAFARMQDGSYGVSEVSGEPLGFDRLEALPWATRSAQEQQARERR
jgi:DnaK suppressor protein